jgi:FAD synthase
MSEKLNELLEQAASSINPDDIKITPEADGYSVEVDDETETYRTLVNIGKNLKSDASDQEAFELALKTILNHVE